jgi:CysZ protein
MPRSVGRPLQRPVDVFEGVRAFLGGIGFIVTTPGVWGYALVPVTMLLLLGCGLSGLFAWGSWRTSVALFGEDPGTWGLVGSWLMRLVLLLVSLLVAMVLGLTLAQPLSGFALEAISHAQEYALTGHAPPKASFVTSLWSTTRAVLFSLLVGGPLLAILFTIGFFFPPATVVTVPLKFLVCGWMLAWDFIDYPLAMRDVGVAERIQWVARNWEAFTIFGLGWALLVFVPGIVLLLLPMGVAGATRLVVADDYVQGMAYAEQVRPVQRGDGWPV